MLYIRQIIAQRRGAWFLCTAPGVLMYILDLNTMTYV